MRPGRLPLLLVLVVPLVLTVVPLPLGPLRVLTDLALVLVVPLPLVLRRVLTVLVVFVVPLLLVLVRVLTVLVLMFRLPLLPRRAAPASRGRTRDTTAAVTTKRAARRSGDPPNGERTGRATQNGMRIRM